MAKNSKKGIFAVVGTDSRPEEEEADSDEWVSLNGSYKLDQDGNLKSLKGKFNSFFIKYPDFCTSTGNLKAIN